MGYSDNAKSFIAGVHFMEKVFTCDDFKQRFGVYEIKHIKIPLYSPWQGAVWERLIRTFKNYFRIVTVLSDIQHAINCRHLTYRCSDNISLEVLTPNNFLKPNVETNFFLRDARELLNPSNVRK